MPKQSKRSISFIKPSDPPFIKRMKEQLGYVEGPTVETKREQLPGVNDDEDERLEDQPQIVVLKPGHLTSEEFEIEKRRLDNENNLKPFDPNEKPVFRPRKKLELEKETSSMDSKKFSKESISKKRELNTKLLSFNVEEEEDDD